MDRSVGRPRTKLEVASYIYFSIFRRERCRGKSWIRRAWMLGKFSFISRNTASKSRQRVASGSVTALSRPRNRIRVPRNALQWQFAESDEPCL